ncbi:MAG TPA: hypothetical protein VHF58_06140 [Solirubrobacterales bacterium]|nr:hypothetical protein [Solirubrobacterales bacterium]
MTKSTSLDRKRFAGLTALAAATLALLIPSASHAGALVHTSPNCDYQDASRVFLPWGDIAHYGLAPDGAFESGGEGWSLSGGASVIDGNSTHYVRSADDAKSLSLPAGSSALSPTTCVGLEHPTLRFFSKKVSGSSLLSSMTVSVRTETALGLVVELPVGVVTPTGSWQPTLPMTVVANLLPLLPGEYAPVQFRFTPVLGSWQIDDVYVDPTRRS